MSGLDELADVEHPGTGAPLEVSDVVWLASASQRHGAPCVEVAFLADAVAVRHSGNPDGPVLVFTTAEWDAFVDGAKDGEFDV